MIILPGVSGILTASISPPDSWPHDDAQTGFLEYSQSQTIGTVFAIPSFLARCTNPLYQWSSLQWSGLRRILPAVLLGLCWFVSRPNTAGLVCQLH